MLSPTIPLINKVYALLKEGKLSSLDALHLMGVYTDLLTTKWPLLTVIGSHFESQGLPYGLALWGLVETTVSKQLYNVKAKECTNGHPNRGTHAD